MNTNQRNMVEARVLKRVNFRELGHLIAEFFLAKKRFCWH